MVEYVCIEPVAVPRVGSLAEVRLEVTRENKLDLCERYERKDEREQDQGH